MQRSAVLSRFRSVLLLGAALSLFAAALAPTAAAQRYDFPPKPSGPVLDQGNMLSGGEERALARKLAAYEDTSSTAVVVVTLSSLDGAPVDDYAISLGRDWGVGQEGKDNGVVVLVSKNDRKMFIATGYGVEGALPDAIANRIVEPSSPPRSGTGTSTPGSIGGPTPSSGPPRGSTPPRRRLLRRPPTTAGSRRRSSTSS